MQSSNFKQHSWACYFDQDFHLYSTLSWSCNQIIWYNGFPAEEANRSRNKTLKLVCFLLLIFVSASDCLFSWRIFVPNNLVETPGQSGNPDQNSMSKNAARNLSFAKFCWSRRRSLKNSCLKKSLELQKCTLNQLRTDNLIWRQKCFIDLQKSFKGNIGKH